MEMTYEEVIKFSIESMERVMESAQKDLQDAEKDKTLIYSHGYWNGFLGALKFQYESLCTLYNIAEKLEASIIKGK